jgi:hypothetical protein
VNGAGASDVSVGHATGTALDADPDYVLDGGLGAPVLLDGGQGARAAVPGKGTGALLEMLNEDAPRAIQRILDGEGLAPMRFVSTVLRGATEVVLAEIEAQRRVRYVAALAEGDR